MMTLSVKQFLKKIQDKEIQLNILESMSIEKSVEMIKFIQVILLDLKEEILQNGFENQLSEIDFFKNTKPYILSKLIFYNKVYRIETSCPIGYNSQKNYYVKKVEELHLEYKRHFSKCDFYKYYKASRSDKDVEYFTLGNINLLSGINSFAFEMDLLFSTYYDYRVSRILAHDLLQKYLHEKISDKKQGLSVNSPFAESLIWSESHNALIELIYALYVSGSINYGKIEIRSIAVLFQQLFGLTLSDIHHAFHRMKTRAKSKTCYLDKLKQALEEYMDKEY